MISINEQTFPDIHAEYSSWVRHKLLRKGIPPADLDDVSQLTWLYVWKYRSGFDNRYPLAVFLAINATSAAGLYWRGYVNQPELVQAGEDIDLDDQGCVTGVAPQTPASAEMVAMINDVMNKLPHRWRHALELEARGELEQLIDDIGSPATFQLLHRARQRFRSIWQHGVVQDGRKYRKAAA